MRLVIEDKLFVVWTEDHEGAKIEALGDSATRFDELELRALRRTLDTIIDGMDARAIRIEAQTVQKPIGLDRRRELEQRYDGSIPAHMLLEDAK